MKAYEDDLKESVSTEVKAVAVHKLKIEQDSNTKETYEKLFSHCKTCRAKNAGLCGQCY